MPEHVHHPARFTVTKRCPPEVGNLLEIRGTVCHDCGARWGISQRGIPETLAQVDPVTGQTFTVNGYRGTSTSDRRDLAVLQDPDGIVAKARFAELSPTTAEPAQKQERPKRHTDAPVDAASARARQAPPTSALPSLTADLIHPTEGPTDV